MTATPIGKRQFHTFISHAHVDRSRADQIVEWLRDIANIPTWYDADRMTPGSMIASTLYQGIEESRSLILLVSAQSVSKKWVEHEYSAAIDYQAKNPQFRIIPIRLEDVTPPGFITNYSNITVAEQGIDLAAGSAILRALYKPSGAVEIENGRNVYVSRGWHSSDESSASKVCSVLSNAGLQLVGDAEDQTSWVERRVAEILSGCGAFVGILPHRAQSANGTSKYVLREWELARAANLPCLVFKTSKIELPVELAGRPEVVAVDSIEDLDNHALQNIVDEFAEDYTSPRRAPYIFYATDFGPAGQAARRAVKDLVESISAIPCILGEYVQGEVVQRDILSAVAKSTMVLADISGDSPNVYIELGCARGAEVPVTILRHGPPGRPAFMLRDQQVWDYSTPAELLGRVFRIVYPLRRALLSQRG